MSKRAATVLPLLALGGLLVATRAHAQAASNGAAIELFDDANRLMSQGKFGEACPKFWRSNEISPNGGTLIALADCYEKSGQLASSWTSYLEVARRARAAEKPEAEQLARAAAGRLEARVAWLTINVGAARSAPTVTRDGQEVPAAAWGVRAPVDPGPHTIEARAPGRAAFTTTVTALTSGGELVVAVPSDLPAPASAPERDVAAPSAHAPGASQRLIGLTAGGLGIVGVGLGVVFGLNAASKNNEAATHCRTEVFCDPEGVSVGQEAKSAATVSSVAFIAGGALLAGGVILYLTAPRGTPASARAIRVDVTAQSGVGLSAAGSF